MTISYNWLCDYLPELPDNSVIEPQNISRILTAIGLEVENYTKTESVKGGLKYLVAGEVLTCVKHPDADKLKVTTVNIGTGQELQIICGASNIAAGQKVIVAPVNTEIHPISGDPIVIKKAKIRGMLSEGMICSEDEIGLGTNHDGILILPEETVPGTLISDIFKQESDYIFEIGLTPNRIDAMSHIGVAKDVCAYLSHHFNKEVIVRLPYIKNITPDIAGNTISVSIENKESCKRYSGVLITGITVESSPEWLQIKLKSIGVKPINNIVDITNFILHETGQPLHAFDADKIKGKKIIVKNFADKTSFITLDNKERKLSQDDLIISNESEPMCLAGTYGGIESGVTTESKNIFLESAWFKPSSIRRTSLRHGLRTDAAARFEKGTDISNTVTVLIRAALLIKELTGGMITGDIIDIYPEPLEKNTVGLKYHYLKKLSGKNYHGDTVKNIFKSLGFEILKDGADEIRVNVPFSKPDITLPADLVEEIMRIDGLDNIQIPETISISPAVEQNAEKFSIKEKIADYLIASGCFEIFTNSISNSQLYDEETLKTSVKMINNLSSELDIMRPSMLQSGLSSIAYNVNRKNTNLSFFEFGKTYTVNNELYKEANHLCLYLTGEINITQWQQKASTTDLFFIKGVVEKILSLLGVKNRQFKMISDPTFKYSMNLMVKDVQIGILGELSRACLDRFDIRQPVFFADMDWDKLLSAVEIKDIKYKEISKYPAAKRDLAIVLDKKIPFASIEKATSETNLSQLTSVELFDIFESEKLGTNKKSMAINFTFADDSRTLTDIEIDGMMNKLISVYEKELNAEIRK